MNFDWSVTYLDYNNKLKNLDTYAKGVVKSNKFFPVFKENNQEFIFKPLSKTKPLCTPYFAYSEVFWSTVINQYFLKNTPIYKLAVCQDIELEFPSKYNKGTYVESLIRPDSKLVNLYEICIKYTDTKFIKDYTNFCEEFYDYTKIINSKFMNQRDDLNQKLCYQILLSILKADQNYHYENPLFYEKNNEIIDIAPMIDHEFSTFFMHLDSMFYHKHYLLNKTYYSLEEHQKANLFVDELYKKSNELAINLDLIIKRLNCFITDLKKYKIILEDNNFIEPFNSFNFEIGRALFKENDINKANELKKNLTQYNPSLEEINELLNEEILNYSINLENIINKKLLLR